MHRNTRRLIAALIASLVTLFVMYGNSGPQAKTDVHERQGPYHVVSVVDGDTARVAVGTKVEPVRFIGIDTPEVAREEKRGECFGEEASARTQELLNGRDILLAYDTSQGERDTYGRILAYPILEDGTNVGELLVREGYAREYTFAAPYAHQEAFRRAEAEAKRAKRGMWGACGR